ncbi:MAG: hypothetical protein NWR72_01455 [Bacteroidia bacterium]|nr:hypothetical protein [Bacteroidia bacterium]
MKRLLFSANPIRLAALAVALAFTFSACNPDTVDGVIAEDEIDLAITEATTEATYDEVDDLAMEAMERTDNTLTARTWATEDMLTGGPCVTITHDSVAKTILVDFGTGCVGPDGKTRSGAMLITYTKRLFHPGASMSVALQNYVVDSLAIEGTRSITNLAPNYQSNIILEKKLVGGKITWPDGTFATRDFVRTSTWVRAANPVADEFHVDGTADAVRRNGSTYRAEVVDTLIWKRRCLRQGIRIPAEGTTLIQRSGKPDLSIDFGNGVCDYLITITINNKSKTVDVRNL